MRVIHTKANTTICCRRDSENRNQRDKQPDAKCPHSRHPPGGKKASDLAALITSSRVSCHTNVRKKPASGCASHFWQWWTSFCPLPPRELAKGRSWLRKDKYANMLRHHTFCQLALCY